MTGFFKKYWKNIIIIACLSIFGTGCIFFTYLSEVEFGKKVGRCEHACFVRDGKFLAVLDKNECQCQSKGKITWIYSVEIGAERNNEEFEGRMCR